MAIATEKEMISTHAAEQFAKRILQIEHPKATDIEDARKLAERILYEEYPYIKIQPDGDYEAKDYRAFFRKKDGTIVTICKIKKDQK